MFNLFKPSSDKNAKVTYSDTGMSVCYTYTYKNYLKSKPKWYDKLYKNTTNKLDRYFYEVIYTFNEWKKRVVSSTNNETESFGPYTFCSKGYIEYRSPWGVYVSITSSPTITEFTKFIKTWSTGVEVPVKGLTNLFDFETQFLDFK